MTLVAGEQAMQVVDGAHSAFAQGDDDVAGLEAGSGCRAFRFNGHDAHSAFGPEAKRAYQLALNGSVLRCQAEEAAPYVTFLDEPARNKLCRVAGNGKTKTLRRENHRSVHADHFTDGIHQRPARVTRVERGISLYHIIDQASGFGTHRAPQRADDSGRDGMLESIRTADGNGHLAYFDLRRVRELAVFFSARGELDDREIGLGIIAYQFRFDLTAVGQAYLYGLSARYQMTVGKCVPIRRDDKTRSTTRLGQYAAPRRGFFHRDVNDRRAHALDGAHNGARVDIVQRKIAAARHIAQGG